MKNLKVFITDFHYKTGKINPFVGLIMYLILFIPSLFYFFAIKIKNFLYTIKLLKEKEAKPYVICVGNLTTGGVGKTPVVFEIANYIANTLNKKTAVIYRGYKGKLDNKKVNIIKDYNKIYYDDGAICGDEALLCTKNTKNCIVLTSKNRKLAADFAYNNFGCQVVILDDGFSNRKIKKDLSIVIIDSKKQFGNSQLLPLGPLREPLSEIKRADLISIMNKDDENCENSILKLKKKIKNKPLYKIEFLPDYYYNIKNSLEINPSGENILAFCAIGQPEQFYTYLKKDFNLVFKKSYPDHWEFKREDINYLIKKAKELNANYILTTQKDEVKIKPLLENQEDIAFISLKMKVNFPEDNLLWAVEKRVREL